MDNCWNNVFELATGGHCLEHVLRPEIGQFNHRNKKKDLEYGHRCKLPGRCGGASAFSVK